MWEVVGYFIVALACIACAWVLGSAFDDQRCLRQLRAQYRTSIQLQKLEELAQAGLLVASQMPGLGEHAFDHFHGVLPLPIDAGVHELVARSRARTMRRNNLCDDGSEFV